MNKHSKFSTLLHEPLFHFLLIGAGIFFLYAQLDSIEESEKEKIIITKEKIDALALEFSQEESRQPSADEIEKKLENDIREEVLYREAISIKLDKDDMIIRRRLIEKMKYLFEDVAMIDEPSDEVLKAYFQESQVFSNNVDGTKNLEYSKFKHQVKSEWIEKQQQKENEAFYEGLKSRYEIIIDDEVRKESNLNVGIE